jgi:hypothetical protein
VQIYQKSKMPLFLYTSDVYHGIIAVFITSVCEQKVLKPFDGVRKGNDGKKLNRRYTRRARCLWPPPALPMPVMQVY